MVFTSIIEMQPLVPDFRIDGFVSFNVFPYWSLCRHHGPSNGFSSAMAASTAIMKRDSKLN